MYFTDFSSISKYRYQIVYADPPWAYYGSPTKMAAAGKHYQLMRDEDIFALPVSSIMHYHSALFLWATGPKLHTAIKAIEKWNLCYRGVAFVWVKTAQDGHIINGCGVTPTFVKPITEYVLVATRESKGRPFPIRSLKIPQVILHARLSHSEKPELFRKNILDLCGGLRRIELFARTEVAGWDAFGNEWPPPLTSALKAA